MKCPLFILIDLRAQMGEETDIGECIGDNCAWYDETVECCALVALVRVKTATGAVLGRIADNLPERS